MSNTFVASGFGNLGPSFAGVILGGSAIVRRGYKTITKGGVNIGGVARTSNFGLGVSAGGSANVLGVIIGFDATTYTNNLVVNSTLINTDCDCNPLPATLQLIHNLGAGGLFRTFLFRNGVTIARNIPVFYDNNSRSWHGSQYLTGTAINTEEPETWNLVFEWACTAQVAAVSLGTPVWKFGLSIARTYAGGGANSRMLMTFASNGPCISGLVDFVFKVDVNSLLVTTDPRHFVNDATFHDGIGMFAGTHYRDNPVVAFNITSKDTIPSLTRLDSGLAYPPSLIFPEV